MQLKYLAHGFSLLLSALMCVFWIITSGLLARLYNEFCDNLADPDAECDERDEKFIVTPVLGFFCFIGWVRNL